MGPGEQAANVLSSRLFMIMIIMIIFFFFRMRMANSRAAACNQVFDAKRPGSTNLLCTFFSATKNNVSFNSHV